jgi:DNA repair ATPase RecN
MADNGNGDDDARLDIESSEDKTKQLKEIDNMMFDPDQYEDIIRDFHNFVSKIVDNQALKKFHKEYQTLYKALVASHKNEDTYIKDCKAQIEEIWKKAQMVKSAIRMAAHEVDKIEDYKLKVEEEQQKVQTKKEESEEK